MMTGSGDDELWTPADRTGEVEVELPYLLNIPLAIADALLQERYTPQRFHAMLAGVLATNLGVVDKTDCALVLQWCLAAAHDKGGGESELAIKMDAAASGDEVFATWCDSRLDATLGARPSHVTGIGSGGGTVGAAASVYSAAGAACGAKIAKVLGNAS
mmetsp:Transcript_20511/g.35264  ORF Transcript_20511/g.35264 Transcript_20511/m.35264 type:complete len:159 (-) Transcript_20511:345-821(-)